MPRKKIVVRKSRLSRKIEKFLTATKSLAIELVSVGAKKSDKIAGTIETAFHKGLNTLDKQLGKALVELAKAEKSEKARQKKAKKQVVKKRKK